MKRNKIIATVMAFALFACTGASSYAANNIILSDSVKFNVTGDFTTLESVNGTFLKIEEIEMPVITECTIELNSIGELTLIEVTEGIFEIKAYKNVELPSALDSFQPFTIIPVEK